MSRIRLNVGLAVLAVLLATTAWLRWRRALATAFAVGARVTLIPPVDSALFFSPDPLDAAVHATVAGDPFRLANAPSHVSFASTLAPVVAPAAPPPPPVRPRLIVRAIMGGPPWSAILDGVPGQSPDLVVIPGASYDKIRITSIGRDTVVVQAPDTTWRLTMSGGGS